MKIYTLITLEMGMLNEVQSFKTKKSAYEWLKKKGYDEEIIDTLKTEDGYYSDDNGYEVCLTGSKLN